MYVFHIFDFCEFDELLFKVSNITRPYCATAWAPTRNSKPGVPRALELVTRMFKTIEIGELYTGKIVSTTTFGAFMEVLPGKDGLIHISELAEGRTAKTEDVVSVGDVVTAKCIGIDDKGRVKMSVRAALRDAKAAEAEASFLRLSTLCLA